MKRKFLISLRSALTTNILAMILMPVPSVADSIMFQANLERTGVYDDAGPERKPELIWKFDAGSAVFSTPLVYEEMAYFVSFEGGVYAVDKKDGTLVWEKDLGGQPSFQITMNENLLLVGYHFNEGDGGYLMAIDRLSGEERWRFETEDHSGIDAPSIYDDKAYIVSFNHIYSLDLITGDKLWQHPVSGGDRPLLIFDETLFFQDSSQTIYSLSLDNGALQWAYTPSTSKESLFSTPAINDCCIYALINDAEGRKLFTINRHDGHQEAAFPTHSSNGSSVSLINSTAFFGDDGDEGKGNNGYMNAMNTENGELIWRFETEGFVRGAAAIAGDTVYFGSGDHYMYAVDRYTGEMQWRYATDAGINSTPAVADGRLYFGGIDGYVYALE